MVNIFILIWDLLSYVDVDNLMGKGMGSNTLISDY